MNFMPIATEVHESHMVRIWKMHSMHTSGCELNLYAHVISHIPVQDKLKLAITMTYGFHAYSN